MVEVTPERFEQLVEAAINVIPDELARLIDNVAILIEDEAPADDPRLLGLYEGVPLTERDSWYIAAMPDRIRIFRLPILRMCQTQAEVVREVYHGGPRDRPPLRHRRRHIARPWGGLRFTEVKVGFTLFT